MPLIEEILEHAKKDLDPQNIIKYIIVAKPELTNQLSIHPDDIEAQKKLLNDLTTIIIDLYSTWIQRVKGITCAESVSDLTTYGANVTAECNKFFSQHKFECKKSVQYPETFLTELQTSIVLCLSHSIDTSNINTTNNYVFDVIKKCCDKVSDVAGVAKNMPENVRDFHQINNGINKSQHFLAAVAKTKKLLIQYFQEITTQDKKSRTLNKQKVQSSSSVFSFFNCFGSRTKEPSNKPLLKPTVADSSINGDLCAESVVQKKSTLINALESYRNERSQESEYHYQLLNTLFSCFVNPFSKLEKLTAVNKLIYWKKREQNLIINIDPAEAIKYQFTARDIAAIRDHRLGDISREYQSELPQTFLIAENHNLNNDNLDCLNLTSRCL